MGEESYSITQEGYSNWFLEEMKNLLMNQSLVDLTLICSSQSIKIHKAVLIANSPYFKEHLLKNDDSTVVFECKFQTILSIVEFIYSGKTSCAERDLDELISAAQLFKIKGLSDIPQNSKSELPLFSLPIILHTREENENFQPVNLPTKGLPEAMARFKININQPTTELPLLLETTTRLPSPYIQTKKRGRPKKSSICQVIKTASDTAIQEKCEESVKFFEYINKMAPNLMKTNYEFQLPEKSIPEGNGENQNNANLSEKCMNTLENLGIPTNLPLYFQAENGLLMNINDDLIMSVTENKMLEYKIIEDFGSNCSLGSDYMENFNHATIDAE